MTEISFRMRMLKGRSSCSSRPGCAVRLEVMLAVDTCSRERSSDGTARAHIVVGGDVSVRSGVKNDGRIVSEGSKFELLPNLPL